MKKKIKGYDNEYYIDENGVFYKGNKVLKQTPQTKGYLTVTLYVNGKQVRRLTHRLVALAFIPNPHNLPQVNHKDLDKTNNCKYNLEWVSSLGNRKHAVINGNTNNTRKLSNIQIKEIRKYLKEGILYQTEIAKLYNISAKAISEIKRNKTYKY